TAKVRTASGTEITVKYKIMDVNDLITSNKANGAVNPDYPQELQPRDRTREASHEQVNRIARNLDPELLGANRMASDGAPIIGNDRVVESGNGRVMAIRQAFNSGNADNYVKWLREHAEDFGLNNADFDGIKQPVLVRERQGNIDRVKFVQQANISTVSSMSPAERAKQDAGRITAAMLAKFNPNKEIRYNSEFIQDFGALIVEGSERGAFIDKDGKLSAQGLERVQNALLALAYQDDNLLIRMRETLDNDIKNVTNAMLQAAPKIAMLERGVKTGEIKPEFSIHKDITQAASALAQIRQDGMSVQDYLAQGSLFSDANISDNAKILLKFFDDNKRSTKRITYLLTRYADLALDEGASGQQSMLGDERGKSNLLNDAIKYAKDAGNYGQLSLFGGEGEIYEQRTPREIDKGQINETYGEDEALDNVLNSDEQYTRNVALGLDEAAEQVGKLEDAINSKAKNKPNADLSIRDDVLNAVRAYDRLTKAGASVNAALSKLLKNERVPELKGLKLSDGAISVLEIFDKVKGSGAKIAAALINYSENALKADGRSKQELLTDALNYLDAKDGYQLDLDARRLEKRIAKILKDLNHKEIDAQTAKIYSKVIAENYKYFARATGLSIDDLINMRAFNFTADGVAKRGRGRPKKNGNNVEYNQIGKTRKAEMDAQLRKHRPDLSDEQRADIIAEIEKLGEQVKAGGNPKVEKAAIHWVLSGHIILPEDNYKIWDAVRVCEQKHLNPLNYSDPNEILVEYKYRFQPDNMRTDPDKVDEFSDKQVLPNGIVTYAVEDSKAGQAAVREVIDTNWGKEANPWCLTARQNDSLTDAWDYWKNYSAIPKRIAFKDGKLSAFCANSSTQTAWWDREDRPFFEGIPYTVKNNGDIFTYAYNEETGKNVKIYGVLKDGTRCEFYENGQLRISYLPDGTRRLWDKSGHLEYEILPDGTKRIFHKNGQMAREYLPDGTERGWHDNGQMSSEYLPYGTRRNW
ncbi:MAG: hypothetical protein IJ520_00250, partial [Synergistaceae bacterium]|nr:hypothetical protein [Synergistaceae bacterium]